MQTAVLVDKQADTDADDGMARLEALEVRTE